MKKQLLLLVMILLPMVASAHDIAVENADGVTIYYNYTNNGTELEVTFRGSSYNSYSNEYKGNVVIPDEVTYMNRTRWVSSIGKNAFNGCPGLTSITIPSSGLWSIGENAFSGCTGLEKVIVPEIVIASWCYSIEFGNSDANPLKYAHHLYSDENTEIKDLVIPNSVTSIGSSVFSYCSGLTSVTIPNSVTSIGSYAFYKCSGLTSITIPNNVKSIGERAFEDCSGLTSVTIGNSVTSIGKYAFRRCSGLTSVTIPNSVTSIGINAFDGWDLPEVISLIENPFKITGKTSSSRPFTLNTFNNATLYVPQGTIDKYKATEGWKDFLFIEEEASAPSGPVEINGIYYNLTIHGGSKTAEVTSDPNKYTGTVVIPESVTYEDKNYSVTSIGKKAFYECSGLTSITIPKSMTSIGNYAFYECFGLQKVIISDIAAWCGIKIGRNFGCPLVYAHHLYSDENTEIKDLVIPNGVTSIGDDVFRNCSELTSVTISNSVTSIGDEAFAYCSGLTSITIPNSVTSIGSFAFGGCKGLTSFTIPNSVTSIGSNVFQYCSSLTSVTIGNSVTSIGEFAFGECTGLSSVTIGNSVTSIGFMAFHLCSGLTSITIPNSVTSIGQSAFAICSSLTSVTIPNSVTSIGITAFAGCSDLTSIEVESGNIKYDSRNNCNAIIETESNTLVAGCKSTNIPNSVTSIDQCAFSSCSGLTSITIPNSVTSIGQSAFNGCSGLTSITIPNSVTSIGQSAFAGCSGLTSIAIPNSVTSIGYGAFSDCSGLTSVTIPNSVTSIGNRAFDSCDLPVVISLIENPFKIEGNTPYYRTFSKNTFENATLYVPVGTIDKYKTTEGWKDFMSIVEGDNTRTYKLTYIVDGEIINLYDLKYGEAITPETAPAREGYTFSGWSEIPETMPAHDVTITGSFSVNQYTITYIIDGEVSSTETVDYGTTINPPTVPEREGYDFAWDEYPETMPAHDIEIKGSYTQILKADPDLAINGKGTFIAQLGFIATLGQPYDSPELINPHGLSPIVWTSSNPNVATVDANGVLTLLSVGQTQIKATFAGNDEYEAGMAEYSLVVIESGYEMDDDGNVTITGGDQTGDVTIDATITINGQTYQVTVIAAYAFKDNQDITSLTIPEGITTIGDNAFNGCINLFVINIGKDVLKIGSMAFANIGSSAAARTRGESPLVVNCYAETVPDAEYDAFLYTPVEDATLLVNDNLVDEYRMTAPWCYFGKIMGFEEAAGINTISIDSSNARIYDMQGNRLDNPQKGVNIIRMKDGKTKKIIVK